MPSIDQSKIRNFCIIAHIDQGRFSILTMENLPWQTGLLKRQGF